MVMETFLISDYNVAIIFYWNEKIVSGSRKLPDFTSGNFTSIMKPLFEIYNWKNRKNLNVEYKWLHLNKVVEKLG